MGRKKNFLRFKHLTNRSFQKDETENSKKLHKDSLRKCPGWVDMRVQS